MSYSRTTSVGRENRRRRILNERFAIAAEIEQRKRENRVDYWIRRERDLDRLWDEYESAPIEERREKLAAYRKLAIGE